MDAALLDYLLVLLEEARGDEFGLRDQFEVFTEEVLQRPAADRPDVGAVADALLSSHVRAPLAAELTARYERWLTAPALPDSGHGAPPPIPGGGSGGAAAERGSNAHVPTGPLVRPIPAIQSPALDSPRERNHPLSPASILSLSGFSLCYALMWITPGPLLIEVAGRPVGATVLVLMPVAAFSALLFVRSEWRRWRALAARHDPPLRAWRASRVEWRRSEESRRHALASAIDEVARSRFAFPNDDYPEYQTFVNTSFVQRGVYRLGGEHLFPDIVVVKMPENIVKMIAQVETRETVSRLQARAVWANLEASEAPLYLYVPAGLARAAEAYALDAGMRNFKLRTWRWQPTGLVAREL